MIVQVKKKGRNGAKNKNNEVVKNDYLISNTVVIRSQLQTAVEFSEKAIKLIKINNVCSPPQSFLFITAPAQPCGIVLRLLH